MQRRRLSILLPFAVAMLAATPSARAFDIIKKKNVAKRLGGTVTKTTKTSVTIDSDGKSQDVPVNEIEYIEWTGQPGTLEVYKNAEKAGRLSNALTGYNQLLKQAGISDRIRSELQYLIVRTQSKVALSDSTKRDAAIAALESHQTKNADSHHFYEAQALLADLYLAAKSYAKALTALAELKKSPFNDIKVTAQNSEGRVLLGQGKPAEALSAYNAVLAGIGNDAKMRPIRNQAVLGKAACLKETKKYNESLKILKDVIASANPASESAVMAEAYLLRGDNHVALGNTKDALFAYLHVDILFEKETRFHPYALSQLARLWKAAGHDDRARQAQAKLDSRYKNWKK